MNTGLIYDIKRYAINDGPGIRVTVFLKGCPLHCAWCHNPEGILSGRQRVYTRSKCMGCGMCIDACTQTACTLTPDGVQVDKDLCLACGRCADACPAGAAEIFGRKITVEDLVKTVEKDRVFFDQSGGGVTFSGGEPLAQADFLEAALMAFGSTDTHRTVDTTGLASRDTLMKIARQTDLFLYDLKVMDSQKHRQWTGVDNAIILDNLRHLARTGADIRIRIPLIQGVNADENNLTQTAAFIRDLPGRIQGVDILAFHDIMAGKYAKLGLDFDADKTMAIPDDACVQSALDIFEGYGIRAQTGG